MNLSELSAQISKAGGIAKPNKFKVLLNALPITANNPYFQATDTADQEMQRRLTFFCDKAEFPSRFFATSDIRHYGPTYRQPYQSIFADVVLQFLVGDDMKEKYFFESWLHSIEDPVTQDFYFLKEYTTNVWIEQFSEVGKSKIQNLNNPLTQLGEDAALLGIQSVAGRHVEEVAQAALGQLLPPTPTAGNSSDQENKTYHTVLYDAWPIGISNLTLDYAQNDTPHRLSVNFAFRRWVNDVFDVESGSAVSSGPVSRLKGSNDIVPKQPGA